MSYLHVERLAPIRQEFDAVQSAVAQALRDPARAGHGALQAADARLEDTYIIRLFAEFEGILIAFMQSLRPARRVPRTAERLIDRIALLAHVPDPPRLSAHAVRNHRNSIVHAGALSAPVVSFRQAFSALSRFLSMLP